MDDENVKLLRQALKENPDFLVRNEKDMVGDYRLYRFLLARNSDIDKAKQMLEDHLKWRKENNLEDIRAKVIDKPFLIENFPHTEELKAVRMGMLNTVVHAGLSRLGEVVHVELLGGTSNIEVPEGKSEKLLGKLYEHYYGFFERRSVYLEELSIQQKRLVRCVQIRDVSRLSLMPQGGVFSVVRKILKSGLGSFETCSRQTQLVN